MSELKPCRMTVDKAVSELESIIHTESKWPGTEDKLEALDMAISALRAQPTNEPLTLDQLQEMDGEPVWIPIPDGSGYGDWAIVDIGAQTELLKAVGLDAAHEECNYGKTWLAYRRKPEGSA